MSSINIHLENVEDLILFINFLYKKNINFTEDKNFNHLLYKAISSGKLSATLLDNERYTNNLDAILRDNASDKKLEKYINSIKGYYNDSFSSVKLRPTPHFHNICGSEALDYRGLMTKKECKDFITYQILLRKMRVEAGIIYIDDYLKNLFSTDKDTILQGELLYYIDSLLVDI